MAITPGIIRIQNANGNMVQVSADAHTWCRWCYATHLKSEQVECEAAAYAVNDAEAFWTPEHIVGWRGFKIVMSYDQQRPELRGRRQNWTKADPGPANCIGGKHMEPHKSPHALCTCGYHALKEQRLINSTFPIQAKVLMWGEVFEHDLGYRSERIRLVGIDYNPRAAHFFMKSERVHNTLVRLRDSYKVGGIT